MNDETIKQLVESIRLSGSTIRLDGERIMFTASERMASSYKNSVLVILRARRDDLIAFLASESSPTRESVETVCGVTGCSGECYETEMGKIHPPLPDPMFFAWRERMLARKP